MTQQSPRFGNCDLGRVAGVLTGPLGTWGHCPRTKLLSSCPLQAGGTVEYETSPPRDGAGHRARALPMGAWASGRCYTLETAPPGRLTHLRTRPLGPTWESPETKLTSPQAILSQLPFWGLLSHRTPYGMAQIKVSSEAQRTQQRLHPMSDSK